MRIDDPVTPGTTQIVNTVTIADDGANGPDPTPGNNTDTDTDNLVTLPGADLTKSLVGHQPGAHHPRRPSPSARS